MHRVEAFVCPDNVRSIKLLERFHFTYEGLLRQRTFWGEQYWDDLSYSLLEKDWRAYQSGIQVAVPLDWTLLPTTPR